MPAIVQMSRLRRYCAGARFYDVLSGERLVYRTDRVAAIDKLALHAHVQPWSGRR
jgi:hypothetical protein